MPLLKVEATKPPKSVITPPPTFISKLFLSASNSESEFHTPEQVSMVLCSSPDSISIISIIILVKMMYSTQTNSFVFYSIIKRWFCLCYIIFCFSPTTSISQTSTENNSIPDTSQILEEIDLALIFNNSDFEKTIFHGQQILQKSQSLHYDKGIIQGLRITGKGHENQGILAQAISYYEKGLYPYKSCPQIH